MKKYLAICSILFTVCTAFTGCGSSDTPYDSNPTTEKATRYTEETSSSIREDITDAVDGIGDAGKDIIDGVTNAVGDIIDGFDTNSDSSHSTHN